MNTRQFLTVVWPPEGPYCIASPWIRPDGRKVYAHRAYDTVDDALVYVLKVKQSSDLYFAPHSLKEARELNSETGKMQTYRTHANMHETRTFFFDIDTGEHYSTQDDTLNALEKFLFETGLPSPFVVSSGYGIHVYWIINTPIESLAWREPATRLFGLAQEYGLHVDPSRTTDQSSVLRIPGTLNLKDPSAPRKVAVLTEGAVTPAQDFLNQLNALTRKEAMPHESSTETLPRPHEAGAHSTSWDGRQPAADEVAAVCEHMRTFRDSGGNVSEPHWHVGVGTIRYCDDGPATVHRWSSGYLDYSEAETQAKIEAWTAPPPGCEKIGRNTDASVCARCPHKDLAKNPLLIANMVYEQQVQPAPQALQNVTPPCPPPLGYELDPIFGVKRKDGKKVGVVCKCPIFPVQWFAATPLDDSFTRWRVKLPDNWHDIDLQNDDLETANLSRVLRNNEVIINPQNIKEMQTFMLAYLQELQKHQNTLSQYDYLGWDETTTPNSFILYNERISADGSIVPCAMTHTTRLFEANIGRPIGDINTQIGLMEFYNHLDYMAQQFIIGASLATPCFRFSNQHGTLICLTGETGVSKSTGAYFAASLWGHPELYCLSGLRSGGTDRGRYEYSAILRNLPVIIDEITQMEPAVAREIVLSTSQPGKRTSLKQNQTFRQVRGGYKANLTICTSNKSPVQMISADNPAGAAGLMRIFEIKVYKNSARSKAEADSAFAKLLQNHGLIGRDFMRRCLPHAAQLSEHYLKMKQQFELDIKAAPEERFMAGCAATALFGIRLGHDLGYLPFDYRAMRAWLIDEQIPAMRKVIRQEQERSEPETIIGEYLEEIGSCIYRTARNTHGGIEILQAIPTNEIKARHNTHEGEIWVRIGPFRHYCNQHNYDYDEILAKLVAKSVVTNPCIQKLMTVGKDPRNFPVRCFVIDMTTIAAVSSSETVEDSSSAVSKIINFKNRQGA